MPPSQQTKLAVIGRLHSQREAVAACRRKGGQHVVQIVAGIGFQRDFGVVRHRKQTACGFGDTKQPFASQQRRRSAAEVHRVRELAGGCCPVCHGANQRLGIVVHLKCSGRQRIEVAVGAFGQAERNVQIQTDGQADHLVSKEKAAFRGFFGLVLVVKEFAVYRGHGAIGVLAIDQHRDFDLAGRNGLDVDVGIRQRFKHFGGDAFVRLHAGADD